MRPCSFAKALPANVVPSEDGERRGRLSTFWRLSSLNKASELERVRALRTPYKPKCRIRTTIMKPVTESPTRSYWMQAVGVITWDSRSFSICPVQLLPVTMSLWDCENVPAVPAARVDMLLLHPPRATSTRGLGTMRPGGGKVV